MEHQTTQVWLKNAVKLMNMSTSELNQMGNSGYDYGRKHFLIEIKSLRN